MLSNLKKVRDNAAGAIGGWWVWKHTETGHVVRHSNYTGCRNAVKKFLSANNFPIGSNFERDFEENLCANGAPGLCIDWDPPSVLEKLGSLGMALYKAAKQWRAPLVSAEQLQDRRDYCTGNETRPRCNFYAGSTSLLRVSCGKCGCFGLKIALVSEHCPLPEPKW